MNTPSASAASVYADFSGLAELRGRAQADPDAALHEVARQFESLFLQMMLASMRDASQGEGLFDSDQSLLYRDMLDKQLGVSLASQQGIGLAEVLVRQLGGATRAAVAPDQQPPGGSAPLDSAGIDALARERALDGVADALARRPVVMAPAAGVLPPFEGTPASASPAGVSAPMATPSGAAVSEAPSRVPGSAAAVSPPAPPSGEGRAAPISGAAERDAIAPAGAPVPGVATPQPAAGAGQLDPGARQLDPGPARFESPREFVTVLWRHAEQAARELGAPPQALLAQAALESGWGKAVARRPDGSSSHNLFGIKADRRWEGQKLVQSTMEFEQGIAVRTRDAFRVYDSYAESFSDYVAFLKANPRYTHALERAGNPRAYFAELQAAGYATDPRYAAKLQSVMTGDAMRDAMARFE